VTQTAKQAHRSDAAQGGARSGLVARELLGLVVGMLHLPLGRRLVGSFLVQTAVSYDPAKAKGLDEALKSLADRPFGPYLLGVVAVGLMLFGLWSFLEARYREV